MKTSAGAVSAVIVGIFAIGCGCAGGSLAAGLSKTRCPSYAAPRTIHRTYIRRDVMEQGVYEVTRTPPEYGWVVSGNGAPRRILLKPYKNISHFQRPYIAWYREHLTIVPEPGC